MRVLAVYKDEQVVWASAEHSPLLFNVVKGLADIASRYYKDVLQTTRVGESVISVRSERPYVLFVVDGRAHDLDSVWEMVREGDIEGVKKAEIFGSEK